MFGLLVHFLLCSVIILILLSRLNINNVIGIFTSEIQSLLTFISINRACCHDHEISNTKLEVALHQR